MEILVNSSGKTTGKTITVIGFGKRLGVMLVDGLFVFFFSFVVATLIGFFAVLFGAFDAPDPAPIDVFIVLSMAVVSLLYYVGFWVRDGQTVGKAVIGAKVIGADGLPLTWGQALLRYVGYIVSGAVLSLGFLWVAIDGKRQGWHDKIARTYVVYEEAEFSSADAVEFTPSDPGQGRIWLILWLVIAIAVPAALFGGLWVLGPSISRTITDIIRDIV
jgi:uncharacterized RDD family membrane protein YckC